MSTLFEKDYIDLKNDVEKVIEDSSLLSEKKFQDAIFKVLRFLETGQLRVATPEGHLANCGVVPMNNLQNWQVHSWVKTAILLAMKLRTPKNIVINFDSNSESSQQERIYCQFTSYNDKFDLQNNLSQKGVRHLPGALAREGSFIASGVILMPSFVNIGAWVGKNTMIDTWATAGSCAQIGENVHIAGGVGIGGVLEPAQACPVLIGDDAFLGSRAIVVEGVIVSSRAVLGANTCLTLSTPIYDVTTSDKKEFRGFVPPGAVVVPGTRTKQFPGGDVSLSCAYIIAYRSEKTDAKVSLNHVLRETGIAV